MEQPPTEIRAPVFTRDDLREWRADRLREGIAELVAETAIAPVQIIGKSFYWTCPGCGGTAAGDFAEEPVSGWENPRWTRSGDDAHLTLTPSLGCPRWRTGECTGHWWLRDGRLIPA